MMTVIAKLKVRAGSEAQFESAARELVDYVKAKEPGAVTYILHRATSDPTLFLYYEVYQDQAAFDAHGVSEQMAAFFGVVGALLEDRPEIILCEELAGKH